LLIAPIYRDTLSNIINLPQGNWRYFFDDHELITGSKTFTQNFPLDEFPVYIRDGAIIPMNITRDYTGFGDKNSSDYLTFLIYPNGENQFTVYHPDSSGETKIEVKQRNQELVINFSGVKKSHILRIFLPAEPDSILLDGKQLVLNKNFQYNAKDQRLLITTEEYTDGRYLIY